MATSSTWLQDGAGQLVRGCRTTRAVGGVVSAAEQANARVGSRPAQRTPRAILCCPANLSRLTARSRKVASTYGPCPARTWLRSSSKATSHTQRARYSISHWPPPAPPGGRAGPGGNPARRAAARRAHRRPAPAQPGGPGRPGRPRARHAPPCLIARPRLRGERVLAHLRCSKRPLWERVGRCHAARFATHACWDQPIGGGLTVMAAITEPLAASTNTTCSQPSPRAGKGTAWRARSPAAARHRRCGHAQEAGGQEDAPCWHDPGESPASSETGPGLPAGPRRRGAPSARRGPTPGVGKGRGR